jgi:hypothetical protein
MKMAIIFLLLLLVPSTAVLGQSAKSAGSDAPSSGSPNQPLSIQLDRELSQSIRSDHLSGLLKYLREDAAFLDGAGLVGKESIRQHLTESFGEASFSLVLTPKEAHVLTPYEGYTTGTFTLSGENTRCSNCPMSESGEYLLVWQLEGGRWFIKAWIPASRIGNGCGCGGGRTAQPK